MVALSELYEEIYEIEWRMADEETVWRSNFIGEEAYCVFIEMNPDIIIVSETSRLI
jgi:hypothetical protein